MSWYSNFVTHTSDDLEDEEELEREDSEESTKPKKPGLGKKIAIKFRETPKTKFALRQVKDTVIAGSATLLLATTVFSPSALGMVVIGAASFAATKLVRAGYNFGKKHIIKSREKASLGSAIAGKVVATTITAAGAVLPLTMAGLTPPGIIAAGTAALVLAKATHLFKKPNVKKREKKAKESKKEKRKRSEDDEYADSATEKAEDEHGHGMHRG